MTTAPPQASSTSSPASQWGRVVMVGGTEWPTLGRKADKTKDYGDHPDLPYPHLLRSLRTVKATSIHTSSASDHCVVIDTYGVAHLFGRAQSSALGLSKILSVWEDGPLKIRPEDLGCPAGVKFVHAATGRAHTLLVASDGMVFSAGVNNNGQCGHAVCAEVAPFKRIMGLWMQENDPVIQAAAGVTFSLLLTASGKVWAFGSGEKGQLGNGRTGEHIVTSGRAVFDIEATPSLVKALADRKIVQMAAGPQHAIVVDDKGYVLVWGCAGYCRLGLGDQKDMLLPKVVPAFAGEREATRGASVYAGPTCSAVIDRSGMYWLAGKWKISGDGSSGQPWSSFRYVQDIMSCKCTSASFGSVTIWALAPDDNGKTMTIGWGQNAVNGELGMGEDKPKSATKPVVIETFQDLDVFQVVAAAHTTYFLVRPSEKLSELPCHPELENLPDHCIVCEQDKGEENAPLECEKCERPFHLSCLSPPLQTVPEGEWFCDECQLHATPHFLPVPNVLKDPNAGEGGAKGGKPRGRPKKAIEQQSAVMYGDNPGDPGYVPLEERGSEYYYPMAEKRKAPPSDDEADGDWKNEAPRKKKNK